MEITNKFIDKIISLKFGLKLEVEFKNICQNYFFKLENKCLKSYF